MLGPRAAAFDDDDTPEDHIDEDLKNDPVSTMDMTVSYNPTLTTCFVISLEQSNDASRLLALPPC